MPRQLSQFAHSPPTLMATPCQFSAQPKLLCIAHTKTTPTDSQLNALISLTSDWMLLWSTLRQPRPHATMATPFQFSAQPKLLLIVHTMTTPTDSQLNALILLTPDRCCIVHTKTTRTKCHYRPQSYNTLHCGTLLHAPINCCE